MASVVIGSAATEAAFCTCGAHDLGRVDNALGDEVHVPACLTTSSEALSHESRQLADVRFGAVSGLWSNITALPKRANICRQRTVCPPRLE
jgi:hypothetical protein